MHQFLPWEILRVKKLEIKKPEPSFVISVLIAVYYLGRLSFSNTIFFTNKISQVRNLFMA